MNNLSHGLKCFGGRQGGHWLTATSKLEGRSWSMGANELGDHLGRGGGFGGGGERSRALEPAGGHQRFSGARPGVWGDHRVTAVHNKLLHDAWLPANWLSEWQPHNTCKIFSLKMGFCEMVTSI